MPDTRFKWLPQYKSLLSATIVATDDGVYCVPARQKLPTADMRDTRPSAFRENEFNHQHLDFPFLEEPYSRNRALANAVCHVWAEQLLVKNLEKVWLFIVDELMSIADEEERLIRRDIVPTIRMYSPSAESRDLDAIYDRRSIQKNMVLDLETLSYVTLHTAKTLAGISK